MNEDLQKSEQNAVVIQCRKGLIKSLGTAGLVNQAKPVHKHVGSRGTSTHAPAGQPQPDIDDDSGGGAPQAEAFRRVADRIGEGERSVREQLPRTNRAVVNPRLEYRGART